MLQVVSKRLKFCSGQVEKNLSVSVASVVVAFFLTRCFSPHAAPSTFLSGLRLGTLQGVKWIVMTDATILGLGQLTTFRAAVGAHSMVSQTKPGKKMG